MPWLQQHNPNVDWRQRTIELINWSKEQGQSLNQITQVIDLIRKEEPLLNDEGGPQSQTIECHVAAVFIDHDETWARAKELANYIEEDSYSGENEHAVDLGIDDTAWVRVKTSTSQRFTQQAESLNIGIKKTVVPPEYLKYKSVFEKKESERLPCHQPWDHQITLKPGFTMKKKVFPYQIPPMLEKTFNEWLNENLEKGYIQPSMSEYASGLFFISKKAKGEYRACQDYRELNEGTVKDKYPLPLVPDLMLKLTGSQYFTKLDLRWGYNNVRIREGDEQYAAFKTI